MHHFIVKLTINASFTATLTVIGVTSILKILRRKQVKIDWRANLPLKSRHKKCNCEITRI